jgi:hypothetical protein
MQIAMTGPLAAAWSISFIAEAALMIRVWRKLRGMYNSFFLYLLADITAALFLAGVVFAVPWDYAPAWITLELVMVGFQFLIAIEAYRRANALLRFPPGSLVLAFVAALACSWGTTHLLGSPNPWPSSWLAPANGLRASLEMFLGLVLLFLVSLPGRRVCIAQFQGKHLAILSAYLIVSALLMFLENHLYTQGVSIPGAVMMFITAGFFAAWNFVVPRKAVTA